MTGGQGRTINSEGSLESGRVGCMMLRACSEACRDKHLTRSLPCLVAREAGVAVGEAKQREKTLVRDWSLERSRRTGEAAFVLSGVLLRVIVYQVD